MKGENPWLIKILSVLIGFLALPVPLFGDVIMEHYVKTPIFGGETNITPNVLVILDNSGSMLCPAYFTQANGDTISCSGPPGTSSSSRDDGYKASAPYCSSGVDSAGDACEDTGYYGYFDPASKYSYAGNKFTINGGGDWDGDFLNWVSMRRIDVAKKVLVGGNGFPKARPALDAPNSIEGHQSTNSQFGNYEYVKTYDRDDGVAAGLFPDCGASSGDPCYFGMKDGYIYLNDDSSPFSSYTSRYVININLTTEWGGVPV